MGHKFNNKTGYWEAYQSKRHPITRMPFSIRRTKCKSEAEAKRVDKQLIIQIEEKIREKAIPRWLELVEGFRTVAVDTEKMTEKTAENYYICLKAHTFDTWGKRYVDSITTQEIRQLIKTKVGDRSPTTQKNVLKFIRGVFKYGIELGVINRDPCPQMKFQSGDKIKKVLTEEQVKLFLNKAKEFGWPWYPHVAMALYTGMRNGELYALTWDKVNLEQRTMLIDSSWNNRDGFKCTKSGDDRIVEIAPNLVPIVANLKIIQADSTFVLPRMSQWDEGRQAAAIQMFLAGLGLPLIRFHDLRATWATIMLSKGIEPAKVMVMGGWKDMKTLMIYLRKAGISIRGITSCLDLHNPSATCEVLKFEKSSRS